MAANSSNISIALTRKLLLAENPNQKITNEALEAANFLLREFILEARTRASVEAEFDSDDDPDEEYSTDQQGVDNEEEGVSSMPPKGGNERRYSAMKSKVIQPKHILKIGCELMMDFS